MKNFVLIYPIFENVHLTTEMGQISYFLHKNHGYSSKIVGYKNNETYPSLYEEVKGINLHFLENTGRFIFLERSVLKYIRKNAKNIDVLMLYHFAKFSFVYGIIYKMYNPNGFLHLKLDAYNETFEEGVKIIHSKNKTKNFLLNLLSKLFLKKVDLISIENKEGERLVKIMFKEISEKIMYLPVGVNDFYLSSAFNNKIKKFEEKENLILSLGRIGEAIKNHEMILRALTKVNMKNWKMVFVGPVNENFMNYYNELIISHPHLKQSVIFTGKIINRIELYEWYNRSKIFCMTSRKESFCHAIAEAFYFGNYIIGTEGIMSMTDITDNEKYGVILKDDDDVALAIKIQELIDNDTILPKLYPNIIQHSSKNFIWSNIVAKLSNRYENR